MHLEKADIRRRRFLTLSLWKNNALILANPRINDIMSLFDRAVFVFLGRNGQIPRFRPQNNNLEVQRAVGVGLPLAEMTVFIQERS